MLTLNNTKLSCYRASLFKVRVTVIHEVKTGVPSYYDMHSLSCEKTCQIFYNEKTLLLYYCSVFVKLFAGISQMLSSELSILYTFVQSFIWCAPDRTE